MKVSNGKCIRRLSAKSMKATKSRNLIAIAAIALTTILFTTLFTIAISMNHSFQQANFRQAGGYSHGTFKYLTEEQFNELKTDSLVKEYGLRIFAGMPLDAPFNKSHAEISYCDENSAKWIFAAPKVGRLPQERTNEAATDTTILKLLGVEPKIGEEFTVTFLVDGEETTETFTLCGWWDYDEAIVANHILIPRSRTENIFEKLNTQGTDGMTATLNMDVMFANSMNIEENILTILENHGYQTLARGEENNIEIGVNWGYTGAQISNFVDPQMIIVIVGLLLIIIFTGYLIIYNVFQISVANDIRHYGLLKTIGTTGKQIKRIIKLQALRLSVFGIPLGLIIGYIIGILLVPVILARLNGMKTDAVSANPLIFIISAIFSLVTVFISCRKPSKIAAKVSPVEAVRYTESNNGKQKFRKSKNGASLSKMALANLGRNRKKTIITIISLSLAVLLLNLTFTFTNGFDMDKYLEDIVCDFILADAGYFQIGTLQNKNIDLTEEIIAEINSQKGITGGGRIYELSPLFTHEIISEENYRSVMNRWNSENAVNQMVEQAERTENGELLIRAQLYGMDEYALSKVTVFDGDISKLNTPNSRYTAAVYMLDDYGEIVSDSHWAKIGDTVTIKQAKTTEYYNLNTGETFDEEPKSGDYILRPKEYEFLEYEVAALVFVPYSISYRYYGMDEFILNDKTFIEDTETSDIMLYVFDTADEENANMENYLKNFTENIESEFGYESKQTYAEEFNSFRDMFLLLGGVMSLIVGLVGILNFLNATLTGILSRRREFAVLQAIGMTGKQLKGMLIWEGLYYTLGSAVASFILCVVTAPLLSSVLGNVFWFFSYRFTILPVIIVMPIFAILGVMLPLVVYKYVAKHSVVERLREIET